MSIQAVNWAIETRVGDPVLKVLLITLANYANQWDQTWHCQETIAHDSEISVRTLRRRLHELVEMGLILVEERRREDGRRTSSMITLVRGRPALPANLAAGTTGQKEGSPAATKVAGQGIVNNRKKDSMSYSEDFEALWKAYPRTKNTSKKAAWDIYRMLNTENQEMVKIAVPYFAEAMRREGRTEDKIKHMQFWLSARMYETAAPPTASAGYVGPAKPFWETATRKQWGNVLLAWESNWQWSKSWGPEPGKAGCHVPQDILDRFDLKYRGHLLSPEQKAVIQERVSKHAVDMPARAMP